MRPSFYDVVVVIVGCSLNRAISLVQVDCTVFERFTLSFRLSTMFIGMFLSCTRILNGRFRQESYRIEICMFFAPYLLIFLSIQS